MKLVYILLALFSINAFATVDGHDRVHLVVANIQDDQQFFIERAPIVGCWGVPQSPKLEAWTAPYKAIANIGCGSKPVYDNINALTCAKVVDSKESDDFTSFSEITLDISGCAAKNNAQFVTMIRTSAKLNFPQKNGSEVKLTLVK